MSTNRDPDGTRGDWTQTSTGRKVYPLDLRAEDIDVRDIAHHLAHQCRFSGATRFHYSVAQHSVLVARNCPAADALWGLLHDASEAYLVDLPRPLKRLPGMEAYREAERQAMRAVCLRFGLPLEEPESVKRADLLLLSTEARDVMSPLHPEWLHQEPAYPASPVRIQQWSPEKARAEFLGLFGTLIPFARFMELRHGEKLDVAGCMETPFAASAVSP